MLYAINDSGIQVLARQNLKGEKAMKSSRFHIILLLFFLILLPTALFASDGDVITGSGSLVNLQFFNAGGDYPIFFGHPSNNAQISEYAISSSSIGKETVVSSLSSTCYLAAFTNKNVSVKITNSNNDQFINAQDTNITLPFTWKCRKSASASGTEFSKNGESCTISSNSVTMGTKEGKLVAFGFLLIKIEQDDFNRMVGGSYATTFSMEISAV